MNISDWSFCMFASFVGGGSIMSTLRKLIRGISPQRAADAEAQSMMDDRPRDGPALFERDHESPITEKAVICATI
jgi:hypothetical protein